MTPQRTRNRDTWTRCGDHGPRDRSRKQEELVRLQEELVRLQEELDKERQEKEFFQLERDRTRALWEESKKNLEEVESELRRRSREQEEAEESHRVEVGVYKQKLRRLLSERSHASSCASSLQNRPRESAAGAPGLEGDGSGQQVQNPDQNLKHQVELMEVRNHCERQLREVEVSSHQRLQALMEAEHKKRWAAVRAAERQMRSREAFLLSDRERSLRRAEERHRSAEAGLEEELRRLKEELREEKEQQEQLREELSAAQQENRHLTGGLQEAQQHLQEQHLQEQLATERCARLEEAQEQLKEQEEQHRLLLEAFQKVQTERDQLLRSQTQTILEVRQRSELQQNQLQAKLAALTRVLEQKEAELRTGPHQNTQRTTVVSAPPAGPAGGSGSGHLLGGPGPGPNS